MWRRREKTGTALYLDLRQVTLCFWMKADAIRIRQGGMPIRLEEAELLIPHHFPSPRTRPFCHRSSWMGHYAIRLSQVEQLWRGLSSIWKLICCLI